MKQLPIYSRAGMATRFVPTTVINVRSLVEDQLLRVFDQIRVDAPHNAQPLALVENVGRSRPAWMLRAVMVSPELWNASVAGAPLVLPLIDVVPVVDDFLLPQDRFIRALTKLAPTNELQRATTVVPAGLVVTVLPFEAGSVSFAPALVPTAQDGAAGTITFAVGDVDTEVEITYVTTTRYPAIQINRIAAQHHVPDNIAGGTQAYLLHPTLANLLGLVLPPLP